MGWGASIPNISNSSLQQNYSASAYITAVFLEFNTGLTGSIFCLKGAKTKLFLLGIV